MNRNSVHLIDNPSLQTRFGLCFSFNICLQSRGYYHRDVFEALKLCLSQAFFFHTNGRNIKPQYNQQASWLWLSYFCSNDSLKLSYLSCVCIHFI